MRVAARSANPVGLYFGHGEFGLDADTIEVMGRMSYGGIDTVVTAGLRLRLTERGELEIGLRDFKAGGLKLPRSVVCDYLAERMRKIGAKAGMEPGGMAIISSEQGRGPVFEEAAGQLAAATGACCINGRGATAGVRDLHQTSRLAGLAG